MANQYFENNDNLKSEIKEHCFYYQGNEIIFYSDNGVFSKNNIDYGSIALLRELKILSNIKILDVGCGYGTIGITIAKTHADCEVEMIDINKRALNLCNMGIIKNNLSNACCYESNVYEHVINSFDLIVSNPPIRAGKKIVNSIILGAYDKLKSNGQMWCVIQKKQGAASAIKSLKEIYQNVEIVAVDKGYCIIKAEKIA